MFGGARDRTGRTRRGRDGINFVLYQYTHVYWTTTERRGARGAHAEQAGAGGSRAAGGARGGNMLVKCRQNDMTAKFPAGFPGGKLAGNVWEICDFPDISDAEIRVEVLCDRWSLQSVNCW